MTLPDFAGGLPQPASDARPAEETAAGGRAIPLFDKARRFLEAEGDYAQIRAADLYPYFRPIEVAEGTRAVIRGHEVIMAGSNNYLGLTNHPRVVEAAAKAIRDHGTGCTGSRFLNGTLDLHIELEHRLAEFMGKEGCVLFSTGYMTNQGVLQALAQRGDVIFSDKDNHACIVAGAQVSQAETLRFRHDNMRHLRLLLEKSAEEAPEAGRLIVSDGVFSMSGTLAKVPELVELAEEFDAALMLDDAHAIGVLGEGGRGSASAFGLLERTDLVTGTFSKSFASLGGFVVGSHEVMEFIRHAASTHIYSASMPPANVATVLTCLDILLEEPERLERLEAISTYMREGFQSLGFNVWTSQSPIIPVVVGDMVTCFEFWRDLLEEGVFVNAVVPPAVPRGQALMRTSYMATHTDEELDFILEAFRKVGLRHGVITQGGMPCNGHLEA